MQTLPTLSRASRPAGEQAVLGSVASALASRRELWQVLRDLGEATLRVTDAGQVSLFLWDGDWLTPAAAVGRHPDEDLWQAFRQLGQIRPNPARAEVLAGHRAVAVEDPVGTTLSHPAGSTGSASRAS